MPMTSLPGFFITFEGIEGVGKSTCVKYLAKYLRKHNIPLVVTREPGGTPFAEQIRELLLHHHDETVHPDTELLLLFAGRAQHVSQVILPALRAGHWVVSDRFTDASYAYQGGGRGISMEKISALEKWLLDDFRPNLTLILDAPVRLALKRTRRRRQIDRIENERENFFRKVRRTYLRRAELFAKRCRVIDASKSLSKIKIQLQEILAPFIQDYVEANENALKKSSDLK
jgi:dTMP kinase